MKRKKYEEINSKKKYENLNNGLNNPGLPYYELGGTDESIGYNVGVKCRDLIREEIELLVNTLIAISPVFSTRNELLQHTGKYLPYATAFAPELIKEIRGIARGSETKFEEVFFLNCFSDIFADSCNPSMVKDLWGCTSFVAGMEGTKSGTILMGQSFDLNIMFEKFPLILLIKPQNGPEALIYTLAGIVGCIGVNSTGVAVLNNKLLTLDSRPGVPFTFLVRKALEQKTAVEASQVIIKARRATGMNYIIGDTGGRIIDLETTAVQHDFLNVSGCFFAHSNHCLSYKIRQYQYKELNDSILRLAQAEKKLEMENGLITVETFVELTKDHVGYPRSICHHPDAKLVEFQRMKTISAVIVDLSRYEMLATMGNPCQNDFISYSLEKNRKGI